MNYTTVAKCRLCGSADLTTLFSLGEQFVSSFVSKEEITSGPKVPIDIDLCRSCTLVQQRHTAPQDFLYTRFYWYRSSVTATMRDALRDVVESAAKSVDLQTGDVALDIGANDGQLLSNYAEGIIRVACEPAKNLHAECRERCAVLLDDFWDADSYFQRVPKKAKVVTACGCFYDLLDPNDFIADVAKVLHPEGVFIAQLMCLKQTLEKRDVGNFAHEHLEFYSLYSLAELFRRHGLKICDIEENSVNGGSYRPYVRHDCDRAGHPYDGGLDLPSYVQRTCDAFLVERNLELNRPETYTAFFQELEQNKARCMTFIRSAVAAGKRVWVYGASTKGNVILQYYGLDHTLIEGAADRSPDKVGLYTVGTGIPIHDEETFRQANPDYALVLPYAFREEFLSRESAWRERGGRFIFPLPEFEVV